MDKLQQWEYIIERTADLFMRIDTKRAEIIATVMFVVKSLQKSGQVKPTELDVFSAVMKWKQRRRTSC